jgi:hypothetical protein
MLEGDEQPEGAGAPAAAQSAAGATSQTPGLHPERPRDRSAPRDTSLEPLDTRDPARYVLADEPLADDAPVDHRYLYSLVAAQLDREDDRGRAMDAKLATLLAGVVAGIGFSFRATSSVITSIAALLYTIPLALIVVAYTTKLAQDAPKPDALARTFRTFPISTMTSAIDAMVIAYADNRKLHSTKANIFDYAVLATLVVTVLVLIAQLIAAEAGAHGTLR